MLLETSVEDPVVSDRIDHPEPIPVGEATEISYLEFLAAELVQSEPAAVIHGLT